MKNKKKLIGSIIISIVIFLIIFLSRGVNKPQKEINEKDVFTEETLVQNKDIKNTTVYINGEVKNPGVFRLKDGSIMEDLIKAAGGLTQDADTDRLKLELNLAQKLRDGDHIYISGKKDAGVVSPGNVSLSKGGSDGKININRASAEELKTIPGIGDITAQNIIDYREKHGGFSNIEELKNIQRIGDKTFEKLKDKLDIR